jgi:hypothetical protein
VGFLRTQPQDTGGIYMYLYIYIYMYIYAYIYEGGGLDGDLGDLGGRY